MVLSDQSLELLEIQFFEVFLFQDLEELLENSEELGVETGEINVFWGDVLQ